MKRTMRTLACAALACGLLAATGCTPRSERWERELEKWPEDRPMGGTPSEHREYNEAKEAFEAMMAAEGEGAPRTPTKAGH